MIRLQTYTKRYVVLYYCDGKNYILLIEIIPKQEQKGKKYVGNIVLRGNKSMNCHNLHDRQQSRFQWVNSNRISISINIKLFHLILALFVHQYGDVFIQYPLPVSRCNDSLSLTQTV